MFASVALYSTLILDALTIVGCAAACMLVLWQDSRRSSNQLTAVTLACFCLYSVANLTFHFSYPFGVSPTVTLELVSITYAWSMFSLFAAAARLVRVERQARLSFSLLGLVLAVIVSASVWHGDVYINIVARPDYSTDYQFSAIGFALFASLFLYEIAGIWLVWQMKNERSRSLWPMLTIMPIIAIANTLAASQVIPYDVVSVLVIALLMTRLILREHIYKPMNELNRKLATTNEALEQANLIKSQFLANMSHELRTPLNSVIGYTDLIVSGVYGPLNEKQEDRLHKIGRNGRLLLALINDVLDLSKIEAGRLTLAREPIAFSQLIEPLLNETRPLIAEKNLTLSCDYPPDLPPLLVDQPRAEQVLRNVIHNAIRFTHQGGITITAERDADEVVIHIHDTGDGIPLRQQPHIFSSTAVTLSASTAPEARQLGLTLTRHLVQLHGGRIWFTSEGIPGEGTTFSITFPLVAADMPHLNQAEDQPRGTILCIDDNSETLEVLQGMLESASYRVDCALDDKAAWQRIRERIPDVILLDILMPGTDGWQILRKLRFDPKTTTIPVIVISGIDQRGRAQQAGAVISLAKPLRRTELLESVRMAQQRTANGL